MKKKFKLSRYRLDKKLNLKASKTGQLCKSADVALLEDMLVKKDRLYKNMANGYQDKVKLNAGLEKQLTATMEQLKDLRLVFGKMVVAMDTGERDAKLLRRAKRIARGPWWKRWLVCLK